MAAKGSRQAVFLDRDGVLNKASVRDGRPYPPASVDVVEVIAGAIEACGAIRAAGALLFCVTNQPDVARGTASRKDVEAINAFVMNALGLDDVATCFHDDADNCECRKPKPGMLIDLAGPYDLNLARSIMVGDRWRDIEAGARAGCRTVFIDNGYCEALTRKADHESDSLSGALPWILSQLKTGS